MIKNITYFLILFTIFLIIIFFWGEYETLDFNYKINDDKIANFFTSFSGVIVAVSLYYFYEQLMGENLPDLYLNSATFFVTEKDGIFENKKDLKFRQIIEDKTSELDSYFVLNNTGTGTCKNITIKWIYKLNDIKKIIGEKYENFPRFTTENQKLSFIESNGKTHIEIPKFYFYCCAPEFNFNESNHRELAKKLMQGEELIPKLSVEIIYYDSRNNKRIKKFNVEVLAVNNKIDIKFKQL